MKLNRRLFLLSTTATAAALAARTNAQTSGNEEEKEDLSKKFFCGEPCLQAAAPTSMGIAWAVGSLANGWVEFGEKPDLSDARRVVCGEGAPGITDFDEIAVRVRLTGLKPNTKYYYRTKTEFVNYINNYKRKSLQKVTGDIHSFTTLGESGRSHFCVMNDTHARWIPFSGHAVGRRRHPSDGRLRLRPPLPLRRRHRPLRARGGAVRPGRRGPRVRRHQP